MLLIGGGIWLWIERTPIAASYIDDALQARNIPASYRLAHVGFRRQRIEAIRIGPPGNPDLTADWAEIDLAVGWGGVRVRAIDASGVRLRGRLLNGKLSLGAIDRLLPAPSGEQPFELPDIALIARAMRIDLLTPQGPIHARLDGRGNLRDGFRAMLDVRSDRLVAGNCVARGVGGGLAVAVTGARPEIQGPVDIARLDCPDFAVAAPRFNLNVHGAADITRWRGSVAIVRGRVAAGAARVDRLGGRLHFDASAGRFWGQADLSADRLTLRGMTARQARMRGRYRFDPQQGSAAFDGAVSLLAVRPDPNLTSRALAPLVSADATPVGPLLAAWSGALRNAAREFDASVELATSSGPHGGVLRIAKADVASSGGGRLLVRAEEAEGLGWRWPMGGAMLNASAELGGGGLPRMAMSLRQAVPGGPISGSATVAPFAAGGARLQLAPIRFASSGGVRTIGVATRVTLDGPLADGRIEALDLPVSAVIATNGAFVINRRCVALSFARLTLAGSVIGRSRVPLCPAGGAMIGRSASGAIYGGVRTAALGLRGRVGEQPLTLAAHALAVHADRAGFRADGLKVRLGDPFAPTRLDVAALDGAVDAKGLSGRFDGAAGTIAAVPLLISGGAGGWRLASGKLSLEGAVGVTDAQQDAPRFRPVLANDVRLALVGGRIEAAATLREPQSALPVSRVTIRHDLSTGTGTAHLDVDRLSFGKALQPEALTPLTLGVIANVQGILSGQGRIRWTRAAVTSDGEFHTDGLDFAAAFGPVTGLKGAIHFTDLLGLVTAPDQQVTIDEINPGVAVTDGVVRYRILPDRKLFIAEGAWPFAGGTLKLDPSTLDMAQPVARRLTFHIAGLDAATFVQQLEFKNIAVTGKFDGVLPIVFDSRGGRIERGELRVRPGGGRLSYVGDVTNADLGRIARIAFDALKSMRYDRLTIELNGDLDGEIVSRVRFDGANDQPEQTARGGGLVGHILAPVTRLPFRFNITITAPFRGLVNSAQTFVDPSIVLRDAGVGAIESVPAAPVPIQPR